MRLCVFFKRFLGRSGNDLDEDCVEHVSLLFFAQWSLVHHRLFLQRLSPSHSLSSGVCWLGTGLGRCFFFQRVIFFLMFVFVFFN